MAATAVPSAPRSNESAAQKANRLLCEGRVVVTDARRGMVAAICRGEGAVHHVGFDHGGWHCTCPHMGNRCSHVLALKKISAPDL